MLIDDEDYQIRLAALTAAVRVYSSAAGERYVSAGSVVEMAKDFEQYLRYGRNA